MLRTSQFGLDVCVIATVVVSNDLLPISCVSRFLVSAPDNQVEYRKKGSARPTSEVKKQGARASVTPRKI